VQKGNVAEAITHYQSALQIQPNEPSFQNNLAWLLAAGSDDSLRDGHKAVELAQQANKQTGGTNPLILHTLGAALAEAGQFTEAMETAQRALNLAEAQSNAALVRQLRVELSLYQAGKPFHNAPPRR
jgi:Flp pilus assembly protein TadD